MPSQYDPSAPTIEVKFYTFEQWNVRDDGPTPPPVPSENLVGINAAIEWSALYRVPVIGLGNKTYTIAPSGTADRIVMRSHASVRCEPGCCSMASRSGITGAARPSS